MYRLFRQSKHLFTSLISIPALSIPQPNTSFFTPKSSYTKKNAVNTQKPVRKIILLRTDCIFGQFCKLEFVEILIGHIVVLDFPGGFHDSFHQRANIHNRGVLLVLGADKKCGDATRIIIIGNLRFRIRQDQCKLFIRINFFVFLIVFNVFSDSID